MSALPTIASLYLCTRHHSYIAVESQSSLEETLIFDRRWRRIISHLSGILISNHRHTVEKLYSEDHLLLVLSFSF